MCKIFKLFKYLSLDRSYSKYASFFSLDSAGITMQLRLRYLWVASLIVFGFWNWRENYAKQDSSEIHPTHWILPTEQVQCTQLPTYKRMDH